MSERTAHTAVRMSGRDPHETGRAATPLELLFDLTFVIAFGTAADELAHLLVEEHVADGVVGFCFATFAVSWAWINFSWFASAYDTDDWIYRLTTMVQMIGVLILAIGLPDMFESLVDGGHMDNQVMVLGYVVMRVPMILQWYRASRQDPARASSCRIFILTLVVSQVAWVGLALVETSIPVFFACAVPLVVVELVGPFVAEHVRDGTPWHAHHIAERYGLLVIIALGEGLLGGAATLTALVSVEGWTTDVVLLGLAGVGVTFGMWWTYFVVPSGHILHARRRRGFGWGYGHIPLFGALVAVGAGLHTAAYRLEHHSALSDTATVLATAVPLGLYVLLLYALYAQLTHALDPFHLVVIAGSAAVLVLGVALVAAGASLSWSLLVVACTPWVTVVGYETVGHRHNERALARLG
ncbi:low temperature requirement protein A [Nocardioides sp. YIM 152315]|uniref:low temperature requirement protein A n=1 Tax=Nocardioides sp. YIM 152315 TaxID=3031760 RepID=UPI0023DAFF06|nr:low temperature requirement protein A [Nocardioides sp. YIM 152315]MDF1604366.1 low temperature requirement protein A [Nocardioides sp. YIM 152315]